MTNAFKETWVGEGQFVQKRAELGEREVARVQRDLAGSAKHHARYDAGALQAIEGGDDEGNGHVEEAGQFSRVAGAQELEGHEKARPGGVAKKATLFWVGEVFDAHRAIMIGKRRYMFRINAFMIWKKEQNGGVSEAAA